MFELGTPLLVPEAGKMVAEGAETPSPDQVSELLDLSSELIAWGAPFALAHATISGCSSNLGFVRIV
jgi:hypothetical protein